MVIRPARPGDPEPDIGAYARKQLREESKSHKSHARKSRTRAVNDFHIDYLAFQTDTVGKKP